MAKKGLLSAARATRLERTLRESREFAEKADSLEREFQEKRQQVIDLRIEREARANPGFVPSSDKIQ